MYLGKMRQAARVLVGGAQQDSSILTPRHLPHHLFTLGVEHRAPGMLGSCSATGSHLQLQSHVPSPLQKPHTGSDGPVGRPAAGEAWEVEFGFLDSSLKSQAWLHACNPSIVGRQERQWTAGFGGCQLASGLSQAPALQRIKKRMREEGALSTPLRYMWAHTLIYTARTYHTQTHNCGRMKEHTQDTHSSPVI